MSEDEHGQDPNAGEGGSPGQPLPPGLGVPPLEQQPLGVPALGVPGPEQGPAASTAEAPPAVDPAVAKKVARASRVRSVRILILVVVLGLAGIGWVVRTVREARATPADKQACLSILSAIVNNGTTADSMMTSLSKADDKTLRNGEASLATDIQQQNTQKFVDDLNKIIGRCRGLSPDFRTQFNDYCDAHKGSCQRTTSLNPF